MCAQQSNTQDLPATIQPAGLAAAAQWFPEALPSTSPPGLAWSSRAPPCSAATN